MKFLAVLFLVFLVVPITEIYVLIQIGRVIGAEWTIVGVVSTALIGAWLVRAQGLVTYQRAVQNVKSGETPAVELVEGLFLLFAGALLITPGFVTDAIGFICLIPILRRALAQLIIMKFLDEYAERRRKQKTDTSSKVYDSTYRKLD